MPENALRRWHLHQHLVQRGARLPEHQRALRMRSDWPLCDAGCGWPVDPAVGTVHPGCENQETH